MFKNAVIVITGGSKCVKWTYMSRQKRAEFKMVTDQFAAEWRCPNF